MSYTAKWSVCAAALMLTAGSALASTSVTLHPGGEEERLLGKGDASDARFGAFPSSNITFLSQVSLSQFGLGATSGNDCWGYTTPQGKEIAIMGLETGTGFVDITDPVNPVIIGTFSGPSSLWRDIKVIGTVAYVVTEGGSHIQKFDLSNADNGVIGNLGFSSYTGSGASHNIVANPDSGYLYRVGGGTDLGLRAYGVGVNGAPGTATNPSQQAIQSNLYVHDAQVVTYTSGPYAGREIAFLCSGFGNGSSDTRLRVYDVTNKSNMFELDNVAYPNRRFCHQGWLSEDRKYFYVNDELDEGDVVSTTTMHIFNVEDPANIFYVRAWSSGNSSRDHNLYVKGDYIYAANYRSGLRIHDISDPENPVEVAWFDTYPSDDGTSYDGAWSNYPFFPSGNVIISDIQQGLVVVRPALDVLTFVVDAPLGDIIDPAGGDTTTVTISERNVTLNPSTPMLNIRDEAGVVTSIAGTPTGTPGQYSFATPSLDCYELIDWWVSAETTTGEAFTIPAIAPAETFSTVVATSLSSIFSDNAETDLGYTVSGTATDGQWTRGVPVNSGRGDPTSDADGSGRAWLTDNEAGNSDVDNGETILTGPVIDASVGGTLSYSYWLNDIPTGEIGAEDYLRVQYATNAGGTNWVTLHTHTDTLNQWREATAIVGSGGDIPLTSTLRLRFIAADNSPGQVLEAGIDAIKLQAFDCVEPPSCVADTNGDGVLSPADFSAWVAAFNAQAPECDQNADGSCTPADFSAWVANYNAGCD
ncbi:MAG: choice-of-anchor B family protein [Phycisphaerales bacterium]|nr:choice-of-anchor B family protein [Phycisphaerales bacterium]MCB9835752.1 choice-of-anchor B family protein [Phycisphaera sp.]